MIYQIEVTREDNWWLIQVPELNAVTQAKSYKDVSLMAKELIACIQNVETESVQVHIAKLDAGAESLQEALRLREEAAHVDAQAMQATTNAVKDLRKQGLSLRDIAALLGVSHQRIAQLT